MRIALLVCICCLFYSFQLFAYILFIIIECCQWHDKSAPDILHSFTPFFPLLYHFFSQLFSSVCFLFFVFSHCAERVVNLIRCILPICSFKKRKKKKKCTDEKLIESERVDVNRNNFGLNASRMTNCNSDSRQH